MRSLVLQGFFLLAVVALWVSGCHVGGQLCLDLGGTMAGVSYAVLVVGGIVAMAARRLSSRARTSGFLLLFSLVFYCVFVAVSSFGAGVTLFFAAGILALVLSASQPVILAASCASFLVGFLGSIFFGAGFLIPAEFDWIA